ncbi:poly(glycerol-phosphate) alpha-glucosyltransferase, partial [Bacillus safensis]|nr:poly(glycerol-phosphate) alpha-glucosyltransferase [Bacillus safensis]
MFQNWMKKKVEDTLDQSEQHETMASVDMPDMDYYFIMGDVPKQDESLTKSLKTRIKPLADQHKRTAILTLNYDANVKERIHRMEEIFSSEVDILNVYEHYILPESGRRD